MSDQKKTSLLERQMTRRQFLKISGKSIAGLTVSATMLSLFGCTQQIGRASCRERVCMFV